MSGINPKILTVRFVVSFSIFASVAIAKVGLAEVPFAENDRDAPNIVVILADDLGYGDVQPNQAASKIATPSFERLAKEGVNFTDAHSGSAVCTPTRYGLICGRYCWRSSLKNGVLGGYSKPLIHLDQQTIGHVLKKKGYYTGCVGKWHLGLGWQWKEAAPKDINNFGVAGGKPTVDFSKPITDGPLQHGFDESFIIPASLDMSPYVFIKNDLATSIPSRTVPDEKFPKFFRKGEIGDDFTHVQCLDRLAEEACGFIKRRSETDKPFFLYFPMPAPHKPVIPKEEFQGKSGLGPYGDFVMQVDSTVGRVMKAMDDAGVTENTLLIVTSDNGSFMFRYDDDQPDHTDKEGIQGYRSTSHRANGPLRGTKADVWEAGHRVPFFVRWPSKFEGGRKVQNTICHTDILASVASAAGADFDADQSPDSYSFLSAAQGEVSARPAPVVHHSVSGLFAIREGKWKLVLGDGSGGRQAPRGKPFGRPFQLYDLDSDLGETKNVYDSHPDIVEKMISEFVKIAPEHKGQVLDN